MTNRYRFPETLALLLILLVTAAGCDDNDPADPDPGNTGFEVLVTCVDEAGRPAPGVAIGAMSALPLEVLQGDPCGWSAVMEKSMLALGYGLAESLPIRISIRDVKREHVATLLEDVAPEGLDHISWNGRRDDNGLPTPAGYYEAVLWVDEGQGAWTAVDSLAVYQATFDPGQFSYGVTDAAGRLRISDRRMVPAFYDLMPIRRTDEIGDELGPLTLTRSTWLFCDGPDGGSACVEFEAVDGPQQVRITMNVDSAPPSASPGLGDPSPKVRAKDARAWLVFVRPNPFN